MFSFNGKYTKLRYVNLWPKPLQQPHPPIWIPGGGSVETWDFCARPRLPLQLPFLLRVHRGQEGRRRLLGRDGEEGQAAQSLLPGLCAGGRGRRDRRAGGEATTPRTWTTSTTAACTCMTASPTRPAIAPSRPSRPASSARSASRPRCAAKASSGRTSSIEGYVIAGSPKTVRERLREAMKSLNCGHLMMLHAARLDAAGAGAQEHRAVRARSACRICATCGAITKTSGRRIRLPASERAMPAPVDFELKVPKHTNGHARPSGAGRVRDAGVAK